MISNELSFHSQNRQAPKLDREPPPRPRPQEHILRDPLDSLCGLDTETTVGVSLRRVVQEGRREEGPEGQGEEAVAAFKEEGGSQVIQFQLVPLCENYLGMIVQGQLV